MSNELLNLAWKLDIPSGPKFVLVALADRARKDGCWPSRETLMDMTGLGKSAVSSHLTWLQEAGFVSQQRRRQKSAVYTLNRSRLGGQEVRILDISDPPNQEVQNPDISTLEVQNPDLLNEDLAGQVDNLHALPVSQDVQNQDIQIPDINSQEVQNLDIPKENPKTKRSRRQTSDHPEARKLCERLAELMVENECKPPSISQDWLAEARRLLDRDSRPFVEAMSVLEWCQADGFWKKNIHSMPKFRIKYDKLRMETADAGCLNKVKAQAPRTRQDAVEWVRQQWREGKTALITELTGMEWRTPDIPLDVNTEAEINAFFDKDKRNWITANFEAFVSIMTKGQAA